MRRPFNRIAALSAFILLSGALAANADPVIPITNTNDGSTAGTLTVTRTNDVSPGWDEIDLNFASWTVTYPGWGPTFVFSVAGTWTGVGGNLGVSPLEGTDWVPQTTNANNSTSLESFVNVDSIYYGQDQFARGPGSAGSYAWFTSAAGGLFTNNVLGSWDVAQSPYLGPVEGPIASPPGAVEDTLLAKMYVTTGGDVSFEGFFYFWDGRAHSPMPSETRAAIVTFSTAVPEPSAAVLLATGLISAVTCVRRKRR